jgi:radical SAM superfamily enzyme YgiQ (UPF0313 family)
LRILFIRPKTRTSVHAPLGFLHLASGLPSRGHESAILDGMVSRITPETAACRAREFHADVIGFGGMSCEYPENRAFAVRLRQLLPGVTTIFGGAHASGNPEQCLQDAADFVLAGEGEITLPRLLNHWLRPALQATRRVSPSSFEIAAKLPSGTAPDWSSGTIAGYFGGVDLSSGRPTAT